MKKLKLFSISMLFVVGLVTLAGCSKEDKKGCTNSKATNYDASAKVDDGTL